MRFEPSPTDVIWNFVFRWKGDETRRVFLVAIFSYFLLLYSYNFRIADSFDAIYFEAHSLFHSRASLRLLRRNSFFPKPGSISRSPEPSFSRKLGNVLANVKKEIFLRRDCEQSSFLSYIKGCHTPRPPPRPRRGLMCLGIVSVCDCEPANVPRHVLVNSFAIYIAGCEMKLTCEIYFEVVRSLTASVVSRLYYTILALCT